jgi:hypothetical protein
MLKPLTLRVASVNLKGGRYDRCTRRWSRCPALLGFLALAGVLVWLVRALWRNALAGRTC